ncbi:MAG: hypothetical protein ACOYBY_13370 [Dermatophilaceae bacterium]
MTATTEATDTARVLAGQLIDFLETGLVGDGLFTPDVFVDFTPPQWRVQAQGRDAVVALRRRSHPTAGRVPRSRLDVTQTGFVLEVEETWEADGEQWYCRELIRADVSNASVAALSVYCTGDWDSARVAEHRAAIALLNP